MVIGLSQSGQPRKPPVFLLPSAVARRKKWKPAPVPTHKSASTYGTGGVRGFLLPVAALWLLALAAYSNSFQAGLIYDNTPIILKDSRVHAATARNLGLILTGEYWYPPTGNGLYRPLATLSYLFNYVLLGNGGHPAGYHAVNYAIHAANATLAFLLGLLLFGESAAAFAMAALWAVHPVLTESVTNVIGRADLLAAFGVLAALLCFARAGRSAGRGRWLAAAAAGSAIAVFSKESGIVVLAAVVLYDAAFQRELPWRARARGYAAVAAPCLAYLAARHFALASSPAMRIPFTDNPVAGAGFVDGRLTALRVLGRELALLVWPARLSCDYSYNAIPLSSGIDAGALAALAVLAALAAAALWCFRRRPAIFFLLAFGLAALVPTSNLLFPIGVLMAERFLYLPSLAFAGCVAAVLLWAAKRARRAPALRYAVPAVAIAMVGALSARTYARNSDWKDERTLWRSAEAVVPASYRPHSTLAEGDIETALRETTRTLAILDPLPDRWNTPVPYINAGKVYSDKGDSRKAIDLLLRAQRIQAALDPSRTWFALDAQLGRDYLRLGQFDNAVPAFERALRNRFAPELLPELAAGLEGKGDTRGAAVALFEALEATQDTRLAGRLVELYTRSMPRSCAVLSAGTSYQLDKDCPLVKDHMCTASRQLTTALEAGGQSAQAARIRAGARRSGCPE